MLGELTVEMADHPRLVDPRQGAAWRPRLDIKAVGCSVAEEAAGQLKIGGGFLRPPDVRWCVILRVRPGVRLAAWLGRQNHCRVQHRPIVTTLQLDAPQISIPTVMLNILLGLVALVPPPLPTLAQASDSAYCAHLAELALRYAGSPGASGETRPDAAIIDAIDSCNKGDTAKGIKVLEEKLRNNGLTLPPRMAPA